MVREVRWAAREEAVGKSSAWMKVPGGSSLRYCGFIKLSIVKSIINLYFTFYYLKGSKTF